MAPETWSPYYRLEVARMVAARACLDLVVHGENSHTLSLAIRGSRPIIARCLPWDKVSANRLQKIFEGSQLPDPPLLIIPDSHISILQICRELPSFIRENYPQAIDKPINIYNVSKRYKDKKLIAQIRIVNDLVVVKRSPRTSNRKKVA